MTFLQRERVPVHQHLVFHEQQAALDTPRGDLVLNVCEACGFVFNQALEIDKLAYGVQYDNSQFASPYFQAYVAELARYLVTEKQVRQASIIEVGCGKGDFLRALVTCADTQNTGIGFDPSYIGPEVEFAGRLRFKRQFYDMTCSDVPADVIICRHVIEHLPDPVNLLRTMRAAAAHCPGARLFFETPCVEWILRNEVIWDFFYEHCSYFTTQSLTTACEIAGFSVQKVSHVFGGQYLWLEASNSPPVEISQDPGAIPALTQQFAAAYLQHVEMWQNMIRELATQHTLALWGAGAKGVTLANLIDPKREYFVCVVDLNPSKQSSYLTGTGHPIVSIDDLHGYGVSCAVLLNPNYFDEVRVMLAVKKLPIALVNLGGYMP